MFYPPSELVLNSKGQVYHLGLSPENIADTIILVGDQDRVKLVSAFFDTIEHTSQHREFVCHTGSFNKKRISVISSGIGTDNIDIVINELDALANIDLKNRVTKTEHSRLNIIRIGTCGILQAEIPVHSFILTSHAVGLDNVAHFYHVDFTSKENELLSEFRNNVVLPEAIIPYVISASDELIEKLHSEKVHKGITVTSSGFYGPQGRQLRLKTNTQNLNEQLTEFSSGDLKVVNFEMESSAMFALGKGLGHHCATICLGVANRPNMEFSKGYANEMNHLIQYVLERI